MVARLAMHLPRRDYTNWGYFGLTETRIPQTSRKRFINVLSDDKFLMVILILVQGVHVRLSVTKRSIDKIATHPNTEKAT